MKHLQPSRIDVTYSTFDSSRFLLVQLLSCLSSFPQRCEAEWTLRANLDMEDVRLSS